MSQESTKRPNAEQIEFWNGEGGKGWAERDKQMELTLAPFAAEAIAVAQVQPGERVLDIGCGCGGSAFMLLEKVGESGRILHRWVDGVCGVSQSGPQSHQHDADITDQHDPRIDHAVYGTHHQCVGTGS